MKRFLTALMMLFIFPAFTYAGMVYDFVPSSMTTNINGLEFSPLGGDLTVTNTLVSNDKNTYFADFRVVYDYTDKAGDVFYKPDNSSYQVYLLDHTIPSNSHVAVVRTFVSGESEVFNLGAGRYEYKADIVGGNIDLLFNTNLELGHQVEGGSLTFTPGQVPEPSSLIMSVLGILGSATYCGIRRMN